MKKMIALTLSLCISWVAFSQNEVEALIKKSNDFVLINFNCHADNVSIKLANCSDKKIQSAEFIIKAITHENKAEELQTIKGDRGIDPGSVVSWSFNDVWQSDDISSARIWYIKITYEDGTVIMRSNMNPILVTDKEISLLDDYYQNKAKK